MGPFERELTESEDSIDQFRVGFFRRHRKLARYQKVPMEDGGEASSRGTHPEAEVLPRKIVFYRKFWSHDLKAKDWIVAHELGHWALHATVGLSGIMEIVDLFSDLPFGESSAEEAFAECFASYFLDGDCQRKYPLWASAVELVLDQS